MRLQDRNFWISDDDIIHETLHLNISMDKTNVSMLISRLYLAYWHHTVQTDLVVKLFSFKAFYPPLMSHNDA